jgi:hypothetical protein
VARGQLSIRGRHKGAEVAPGTTLEKPQQVNCEGFRATFDPDHKCSCCEYLHTEDRQYFETILKLHIESYRPSFIQLLLAQPSHFIHLPPEVVSFKLLISELGFLTAGPAIVVV